MLEDDKTTCIASVQDVNPEFEKSRRSRRRKSIEDADPPDDDKKDKIEENYYNLSKPTILTNIFVNHPILWLLATAVILAVITGITIAFGWFIDSEPTSRDYLIWDDPKTINYDKTTLAKSKLIGGSNDSGEALPL